MEVLGYRGYLREYDAVSHYYGPCLRPLLPALRLVNLEVYAKRIRYSIYHEDRYLNQENILRNKSKMNIGGLQNLLAILF